MTAISAIYSKRVSSSKLQACCHFWCFNIRSNVFKEIPDVWCFGDKSDVDGLLFMFSTFSLFGGWK